MHIYLKHPTHGQKVAIAEEEAVADEENGWERFDPEQVTNVSVSDNVLSRRRGRSPRVDDDDLQRI